MIARRFGEFERRWRIQKIDRLFSWRRVAIWSGVLLAFAAMLLLLISTLFYWQERERIRNHMHGDARLLVDVQKQEIAHELRSVANELLFLSGTETLQRAFAEDADRGRIIRRFRSLILASGRFDQLRLIDSAGHEVVRVNYVDGRAEEVATAALQDKSARYYMREMLQLQPGQIYISPLDLNIEQSQDELPEKPTIRFGMRIQGGDGELLGMVVINYLAAPLLAHLRQAAGLMRGELLLANGEGALVQAPDPAMMWGGMRAGSDYRIASAEPALWQAITAVEQGDLRGFSGNDYIFDTIHPYAEVAGGQQRPGVFWKLIMRVSADDIERTMAHYRDLFRQWYPAALFLLLLLVMPVALLLEHRRIHQYHAELLGQALQYAGESVLITDSQGRIEYINPAFTALTGYELSEVLGHNPSELVKSTAQDEPFYREMWQTIATGRVWSGRLIDRRKDGSRFPVWMSIAPITNARGKPLRYVAVQRDYTEHQLLQEKASQEEKMRSLSVAVGSIAHEFNNILSGIVGNVYLVKRLEQENPDAMAKLARIEKLGAQASDMIRQMLAFVGHSGTELHVEAAGDIYRCTVEGAAARMPANIRLYDDFPWLSNPLRVDGAQLRTIVDHLLDNACKAIGDAPEGEIRLGLKAGEHLFNGEMAPGICFSVSDNGCGISPAHLRMIFEPFFTTREVGGGTGLGLATVQGMVGKHGGVIEVESEPGAGATFSLWLPEVVIA